MADTYLTIKTPAESQLTEKRSRFLSFIMHVSTEEEAKNIVSSYKKKFYDARHVCYAYIIGNQGNITRSCDDGEPSGTAGRPILGQLVSHQLTYSIGIVVRYFGGVKLGTGPLGVAYKTAIHEAIELAEIEEKIVTTFFTVSVPYADADVAMRFVREEEARIIERNYTDQDTLLTIEVRLDSVEILRNKLAKILSLRFNDHNDNV